MHRDHLSRGPKVVLSWLTLAVALAVMALPSLGFWLDSRSAQRRIDGLLGQNTKQSVQIAELLHQNDELLAQQAQGQRIAACRTGIARTVDLAVLEYLKSTIEPESDVTGIVKRLEDAIKERETTASTCGG
jgi:hypothetical protein